MRKVYINAKPAIRAFEITWRTVFGNEMLSKYASLFGGRGLEFKDYAQYTPEMDSKFIDWKVSLKTNNLLVRKYEEERNLPIFFMIDTNSTMIYASTNKLKAEYTGELVLSLMHVMLQEEDNVGFACFNEKIGDHLLASSDVSVLYRVVNALSNVNTYEGTSDLTTALKYAVSTLRPHTILFIVSDFLKLSKGWEDTLKIAASKFELITIMIRDPVDFVLPDTYSEEAMLKSAYPKKIKNIKLKEVREQYKEHMKKQTEYIRKTITECRGDLLVLTTDKSFISPVLNFFIGRRHKRWK